MKKYFITGLVILLPLALTFAIVMYVFDFLTDPFVGIVKGIFAYFGLLETNFLIFTSEQIQLAASKIFILIFLFIFTVFLGALTRWFIFHYFLHLWDFIIQRIPLVRTIYKTSQDVISTLFTSKAQSFKQVVMVPYPNLDTYTIGLVTREGLPPLKTLDSTNLVAVFVPTTPNPTSGFLMMFREEDLIYLDMKVEDAFKFVVSCGMILAPFRGITKEEARRLNKSQDETANGTNAKIRP